MKKKLPTQILIDEFAKESSAIEGEYGPIAITDHRLAFEYALTLDKLDRNDLLQIHQILMMSVYPQIAGRYRNVGVRVGQHIMPNPSSVPLYTDEWLRVYGDPKCFQNKEVWKDYPDIESAINLSHVEFENIHPFEDGNGRTGRILLNWHRAMNGLPILIIHEGEEQMEYYKWFKKSRHG